MMVPGSITKLIESALSLPTNTAPSSAQTVSFDNVILPLASASAATSLPVIERTSTVLPRAEETCEDKKELASPGRSSLTTGVPSVPSSPLVLLVTLLSVTLLSIAPSLILISPPQPAKTNAAAIALALKKFIISIVCSKCELFYKN